MSYDARSQARDFALQFLYQCESAKLFYFSMAHLNEFFGYFDVPVDCRNLVRKIAEGTLSQVDALDERINQASKNWKTSRMGSIDRNILRIAAYELHSGETPIKVIINEAVELAKRYGTNDSKSFVNGVLDHLAKTAVG